MCLVALGQHQLIQRGAGAFGRGDEVVVTPGIRLAPNAGQRIEKGQTEQVVLRVTAAHHGQAVHDRLDQLDDTLVVTATTGSASFDKIRADG